VVDLPPSLAWIHVESNPVRVELAGERESDLSAALVAIGSSV
jgi:hypothetical protein